MRVTAVVLVACAAVAAACGARDPDAIDPKWKEHAGDVPFVVGSAAGMQRAQATHRPPMYFFTALW